MFQNIVLFKNQKIKNCVCLFLILLLVLGCKNKEDEDNSKNINPPKERADTEGLLTWIQKCHFEYMWSGARPNSGLARVRYFTDNPSHDENTLTIGACGFGIMGLIVGIERGFITREQGLARFEKIISFLEKADRWHGMYSHWIDDRTGKTIAFAGSGGEDDGADIVETSFLTAGLLCVRQYLKDGTDREKAIAERIDVIWRAMEWDWFAANDNRHSTDANIDPKDDCLLWHWSPTVGFKKNFHLEGYNECLLPYILAAASPAFSLSDEQAKASYKNGWSRKGGIVNNGSRYGVPFLVKHNSGVNEVGPMFWVAFSYAGLCLEGYKDENGIDYHKAIGNHALIQYQYCLDNPKKWKTYSENCWGLSAGYTSNITTDYQAMRTNNDVGVITSNAALIAMPYTPVQSIAAAKHYFWDIPGLMGPWGFWDAYSDSEGVITRYLANNQCPVAPLIENYRTGLLWNLFMSSPEIKIGLQKLGFVSVK